MNRVCSSVQKCVLPLGLFVCLFLLGRCVYKLHYSKVKKQERNARTFTRGRPSVPKARYSEISIFRKMVLLAKFRNILSGTKHTAFSLRSGDAHRAITHITFPRQYLLTAYSGFEFGVPLMRRKSPADCRRTLRRSCQALTKYACVGNHKNIFAMQMPCVYNSIMN